MGRPVTVSLGKKVELFSKGFKSLKGTLMLYEGYNLSKIPLTKTFES